MTQCVNTELFRMVKTKVDCEDLQEDLNFSGDQYHVQHVCIQK